jgi:uncharacterized protein involved in outer membrane biogenesis
MKLGSRHAFAHRAGWVNPRAMAALLLYVFALVAALVYVLPLFVSAERYRPFLAAYLSEKLGSDVSFDSLEFTLAEGPGVAVGNVVIEANGKPALSVGRLKARLSFVKAMEGQVFFDEFSLENPVVNITRAKDGSFNIPFLNLRGSEKPVLAALAEQAMDAFISITITNANVRFKDERVSATPVRASFFKANASFSRGILTKDHGQLIVSALVTHKGVTGKALLEAALDRDGAGNGVKAEGKASLAGFGMAALWPYIKDAVPFERLEGFADIDLSFESDLADKAALKGRIALVSADMRLKGAPDFKMRPKTLSLAFDVKGDSHEAEIISARAEMDDLTADFKGKVADISGSDPSVTLTVDTQMVDVNELRAHIPDSVFTPQQVSFLNNNFRGGKARLKEFTFAGSLSALRSIGQTYALHNFSGGISVKDMNVVMPGVTLPFEGMEGSVTLTGDTLRMEGLKGRYGKSSLRGVSGVLRKVHGWPVIDVRLRADLDLMEASHLFAEKVASPEFREKIEEVKITSGAASVDVAVAWDTKEPPSTAALKGKIALNRVDLKSEALGLPMQGLSGTLEGNTSELRLKKVSWVAGLSSFTLDGILRGVLKPEPEFDLKLNGAVSLEDIDSIRFVSYGGIYYQTGLVFTEIGVKGGFKDFHLDYRLDMTGAEYRLLDIIHKNKGVKNVYSFTGSVRGGEKLTIDRLKAMVGDSTITVSGKISQLMAEQGIDVEVESEGANMDDLDKFFLFFDDINGGGKVGGRFSIKSLPGKPVKLSGRLFFNEATFKIPVLNAIFYDCFGEFDLINNRIFLKKGRGRFNESPFRISGQGAIAERPEFTLNVEADSLNLQDLFGKPLADGEKTPEKKKITLTEPTSTPDWTWNLNIKSKKGDIGILHYQDLNTRIRYDSDIFHIDPLNFESAGGKWRFAGDIAMLKEAGVKFDSKIEVVDMEMGRFLSESFGGEKTVEGKFNLNMDIAGSGRQLRDMKKTLAGRLEARSGKGVIHRFNMLSKIFSLLNVLQYLKLKTPDLAVDGMPFANISVGFAIKDGVARTESLMVDSEAMRISAVGSYDIPGSEVDMRVGVMPFVAVDKVLSSIPVAGHVLTGEKKSLLVSYYEVKGPLDDPDVTAVPFESLAAGIGGIFKRLFELPLNAINAISGEGSGKGSRSDNMTRE